MFDAELYELIVVEALTRDARNPEWRPIGFDFLVADEAVSTLDGILERFDTTTERFLDDLAIGLHRSGYPPPWAVVALDDEYDLYTEIDSARPSRDHIMLSAYSARGPAPAPGSAPPVSLVVLRDKAALEEAARKSDVLDRIWSALRLAPETRRWLLLLRRAGRDGA